MNWEAVVCKSCGGAIANKPGQRIPACLFCGADALEPRDAGQIEDPEGWIPFAVHASQAREAFRTFATSSIWYPGDLRSAKLDLEELLLPSWAWSGRLETHWTGLERASTASGKRPIGGSEEARFDQILIPASQTLRQSELNALGEYDEGALKDWRGHEPDHPMEISEVTRAVARQRAQDEMARRHAASLGSRHGASSMHASHISYDLEGKPVLVPVWIGAYRYRNKVYRILVNGQTGTLHGKAPISFWRVLLAILLGIALVGFAALMISLCAGGGAVLVSLTG